MSEIIFQYPLDLTGKASSNAPSFPITLGSGNVNRAFAYPAGPFYTESFTLRSASDPSKTYTREKHFELIFMHEAYTRMSGNQEVCMAVVVTDSTVPSDVVVSAQLVGGPQSAVIDGVKQAIESSGINTTTVKFADLKDLPDTFNAAPRYSDIGDIYGFEYVITAVTRVLDAMAARDETQASAIADVVTNMATAFQAAINAHAQAKGNVHGLVIKDINGLTETEINNLVADVQKKIDSTISEINNIKKTQEVDTKKLDGLVGTLSTVNQALTAVDQNYQRAQLLIAEFNKTVASLQTTITKMQDAHNALEEKVNQNTKDITSFNALATKMATDNANWRTTAESAQSAAAAAVDAVHTHEKASDPHSVYLHKTNGGVVKGNVTVQAIVRAKEYQTGS